MLLQLASGTSLVNGKYLLLNKLGEGGMAVVWAATCTKPDALSLPDEVVLKVLLPEIRKDPEKRKFFLEEARLSTSLDHPNIVRVYKVEQWNDLDLLVMERLWGHGLDELIKMTYHEREMPLPWPLALRMTAMIAEALHYANNALDRHGQRLNVIHRDIKPGNVLLTADGHVKVIDFGIAKASTSQLKTQTGMVKGTIAYMSPEQLRGEKLDIRSDLFSVGVLLFELCTGHRPFYGENFTAMMFNILTKPALDPTNFRSNLPPDVRDLIMSLLDKDRTGRPDDADALRQQLEALIAKEPEEGSIKALADYFAGMFPELIQERSETSKLMARTDPESLLSKAESDALAAQAEALRGGTLGLDALQSQDGEYVLPTGEVIQGVRSTMRQEAGPNAPQPPTQLLAHHTPAPFAAQTQIQPVGPNPLPVTSDAIEAQEPQPQPAPYTPAPNSPNRMPYILSFLILLVGGGVGLYIAMTSKKKQTAQPQANARPAFAPRQAVARAPAPAAKAGTPPAIAKAPTPQPRQRTQPAAPRPQPRVAQPAPHRATPRRATRRRRRRVRRRRRRSRVVRRRLRVASARVAPRPAAPTTGRTQIVVSPPCVAYYKGQRLGSTSQQAVLSATTGRHSVTCESRRHFFTARLNVAVVAGSQLKRPFRLQPGVLRILATHWGNVYLVHPRFGDKKLGVTNRKYRLYQGHYKVVIRHGAKIGVKKIYRIVVRPHRTTTLKVRW